MAKVVMVVVLVVANLLEQFSNFFDCIGFNNLIILK